MRTGEWPKHVGESRVDQHSSCPLEDVKVVSFSHRVCLRYTGSAGVVHDGQTITRRLEFRGIIAVERSNVLGDTNEEPEDLRRVLGALGFDRVDVPEVSESILESDSVAITRQAFHTAIL